jgi:hypothetical protein
MNDLQEKFNKWKNVRLDPAKKNGIRARLMTFMRANPLPVATPVHVLFPARYLAPFAFAAFVLLAGGSASFAAENAVPGDPLYSVKVNFNEPLLGSLKFSSAAKADWQTDIVERRLEETDQLAISGKLSAENQPVLAQNLEDSAKDAEKEIAALKASGAAGEAEGISGKLESSLKAHDRILAELSPKADVAAAQAVPLRGLSLKAAPAATSTDDSMPHEKMRVKIREVLNSVSKGHAENETEIETAIAGNEKGNGAENSAKGKIGAAQNVLNSVNDYLSKNSAKLSADSLKDAGTRLAAATKLLKDASAAFDAKNFSQAFQLAGKALRKAQETRVLIAAQVNAAAVAAETPEAAHATLNFLKSTDRDGGDDDNVILGIASDGSTASSSEDSRKGETPKASPNTELNLNVNGELEAE